MGRSGVMLFVAISTITITQVWGACSDFTCVYKPDKGNYKEVMTVDTGDRCAYNTQAGDRYPPPRGKQRTKRRVKLWSLPQWHIFSYTVYITYKLLDDFLSWTVTILLRFICKNPPFTFCLEFTLYWIFIYSILNIYVSRSELQCPIRVRNLLQGKVWMWISQPEEQGRRPLEMQERRQDDHLRTSWWNYLQGDQEVSITRPQECNISGD